MHPHPRGGGDAAVRDAAVRWFQPRVKMVGTAHFIHLEQLIAAALGRPRIIRMRAMKNLAQTSHDVIGIDISCDWLDAFHLGEQRHFRLPNTPEGHVQLITLARKTGADTVIAFEATGGHEWQMWQALEQAGLTAVQLPPAQVKAFAQSLGIKAKTDNIDAEVIARFATFNTRAWRHLPPEKVRTLKVLVMRRARLVKVRKQLRTALWSLQRSVPEMATDCAEERLIAQLDAEIEQVEREIEETIAADAALRERAAHLSSIPGMGPVLCAMLLALMPELGALSPEQAAALAGVAPMANDSGTRKGQRHITGGRRVLRQVLYQAALVAKNHNPQFKGFAKRLQEKGKPHKVIVTAVARKLIVLANAICRQNRPWSPQTPA